MEKKIQFESNSFSVFFNANLSPKQNYTISSMNLQKTTTINGLHASLEIVWMLPPNGLSIPLSWVLMISVLPSDNTHGHRIAHLYLSTVSSNDTWGKTTIEWICKEIWD